MRSTSAPPRAVIGGVAENRLHLLSLAGGWPGALLARQTLRHKNRKASFLRIYWATVVLNLAGFALVFTPLLRH